MNKPKKFDFVHQTVSRQEACTGWARDYMQADQWKTTNDLPCMNLIIFPASACPTSLFNLVARLLQSAVACEALFLGTAQLTWFAVPGGGCEDWEGVGGVVLDLRLC